MNKPVIEVEGLSKCYRLGQFGAKTFHEEVMGLLGRLCGRKSDHSPLMPEQAHDNVDGETLWAIRDINFKVNEGEVLGIIGKNGAGKSTLLKILSRITEPTHGKAVLRGRVASLLEVGTGFHQELTGRENIYLNGSILGLKKHEVKARLDDIIEFSGMDSFIDTPVKRYSSGMRVRLAFAVAAHLDPEILIIDEVLAVGDADFQRRCIGKMGEVARSGRTVLFVSHNMQAISTLTQRCIVLSKGGMVFDGNPFEAIECYLRYNTTYDEVYQAKSFKSDEPQIIKIEVKTSSPGKVHNHREALEVHVQLRTEKPLEDAQLSVQFLSTLQIPVTQVSLFDETTPMLRKAGVTTVVVRLPRCRLYMGNYALNVYLASTRYKRAIEKIENICPFEVVMHGMERKWPWGSGEGFYLDDVESESSHEAL